MGPERLGLGQLIPAALIFLVIGVGLAGRIARTDRRRAAFLLWGGWLVVTGLVFSFIRGIFHAYDTVALAPAIAALIGMGARCCGDTAAMLWFPAYWPEPSP